MKRFWRDVTVDPDRVIMLDDRPVRTPGRLPLAVPTDALAIIVADEWRAVGETLDPRTMPLTGLANAALDRVAPDSTGFAGGLARYAESDLICYRTQGPDALAERQSAAWDPVLDWAMQRYDVRFAVTSGVMPVLQPPATVSRMAAVVSALSPFVLAGLSPIVTSTGSLMIALAVIEGALDPDNAWRAAIVDEAWQAELWGKDDLAVQARLARHQDFDAGVRFVRALQEDQRFTQT